MLWQRDIIFTSRVLYNKLREKILACPPKNENIFFFWWENANPFFFGNFLQHAACLPSLTFAAPRTLSTFRSPPSSWTKGPPWCGRTGRASLGRSAPRWWSRTGGSSRSPGGSGQCLKIFMYLIVHFPKLFFSRALPKVYAEDKSHGTIDEIFFYWRW